jgi:peptidoglycan hydrolase-like protein with peptidoglycan-binding domain
VRRTRAHSAQTGRNSVNTSRPRGTNAQRPPLGSIVALLGVVAFLVGAAAAVLFIEHGHQGGHGSPDSASNNRLSGSSTKPRPPVKVPPQPLLVDSITPARGATGVSFDPTITVDLSQPIAPDSTDPLLTPQLPGTWSQPSAETFVFHATGQLTPYTTVSVAVPGGASGVSDTQGVHLTKSVQSTFTIEGASVMRLEQLLAELGYLPVSFVNTSAPGQPALKSEPTAADEVPLAPVPGHFTWRFSDTPESLQSLWINGEPSVVLRGAIMAFESQNNLTVDGAAGPEVWTALLADVAARKMDSSPYNYLMVSETIPESLTVWQDGNVVMTVPANTGIAQAPTATGTYTVYAKYLSTTMSGTEPDGQKYHDPGVPYVSYFNGGDAVHGYPRASYGFPQSLGCVELSYPNAEVVFNYDPLGTLVTVAP